VRAFLGWVRMRSFTAATAQDNTSRDVTLPSENEIMPLLRHKPKDSMHLHDLYRSPELHREERLSAP
jgi:hypothetical protein